MKFSIKRNKTLSLRVMILLSAVVLSLSDVFAQTEKDGKDDGELTARAVFESLQAPSLEILKRTTRLDMLDYWDADSVYHAQNALGGFSWIENLTPYFAKIIISPVSSLEIKVLPYKKSKIVMTVYTIGDERQAEDSGVDFYDASLAPLDAKKYFESPDLKCFFDIPKGSLTSMKEIREMIPFPTVAYELSAQGTTLKARLTVEKYMNIDDWNIVKLFLKPEISAEWKDKYKFK